VDGQFERRIIGGVEIRLASGGAKRRLVGYAAKFNVLSNPLRSSRPFREKVAPGAFDDSLASNADVRFTLNHDPNYVMGRTASGTLKLWADKTGLRFELDPPDTAAARDLVESIRRGDISECSFAFRVPPGGEEWSEDGDGNPVRTLRKINLHNGDVAAVAYPAYPQTELDARSRRTLNQTPAQLDILRLRLQLAEMEI
jgi:HK97 family phage prohead protease